MHSEWFCGEPDQKLTGVLEWLGVAHDADTVSSLLDRRNTPEFATRGPNRSPHGVDPELVADPMLDGLFGATSAPDLDADAWEKSGFDDETQQMARLFGYV